jgi:ribosomal protein L11 methyltransferase
LRKYPALDVTGAEPDLLAALLDDFSPTAIDQRGERVTVFFTTDDERRHADAAVRAAFPAASTAMREVDDENWAERSQQGLHPITVGRITVAPPWATRPEAPTVPQPQTSNLQPLVLTISPSMGFGTGHHATTRLCLQALQEIELTGRDALDVGSGSGVLAMAARMLGARCAIGLDCDADAVASAEENLALNPAIDQVRFIVSDLRAGPLPRADVVTANLTGALLVRSAALLLSSLRPNGTLIVSGLQDDERTNVAGAFSTATLIWAGEEAGWTGLAFRLDAPGRA